MPSVQKTHRPGDRQDCRRPRWLSVQPRPEHQPDIPAWQDDLILVQGHGIALYGIRKIVTHEGELDLRTVAPGPQCQLRVQVHEGARGSLGRPDTRLPTG